MGKEVKTNGSLRNPIIGLGGLTLAATLATIALTLLDRLVAAAILGTATVFFWLTLFTVTVVAITAWWTRSTMAMGAEITLRSQESDDRRDVAQIQAIGSLAKVLLRQSQPDRQALPLLSQAEDWLPALEGEGINTKG